MNKIQLGTTLFTVMPVKPRRAFPLQARIWPIVLEAIAAVARIEKLKSAPPEPTDEEKAIAAAAPPTEEPKATVVEKVHSQVGTLFAMDVDELMPIVSALLSHLQADDLETLQRELLSECFADGDRLFSIEPGKPDKFDAVMVGRTLDTWRLMWEALKETYPDFLGPLLARNAKAGALATPSAG